MIHLVLPVGGTHGWGLCGKYIAIEMARRAPIRLYTPPWPPELEPFEQRMLESLAMIIPAGKNVTLKVEGKVLRTVKTDFATHTPEVHGQSSTAYTVFESDTFSPVAVERARRFDHIAAGSSWCAQILKSAGLTEVSVVLPGVDPILFNPRDNEKEFFPDIFTVFSGGKLEYRKGQDLVIRAFKVLQDRHKDVMLVNAWYNLWPATIKSLAFSPHIQFPKSGDTYDAIIRGLLSANGIDLARTLIVGLLHNSQMARVYKNTDVGLFPNRCEGGTNMVLMEYMACGKPAIASLNSGHTDVISDSHAIPIRRMHDVKLAVAPGEFRTYFESDLEETIEHLEWAYQNRQSLRAIGEAAGKEMAKFTWGKTADRFLEVLGEGPSQ
jgi:glycosyltransferase involved in cell wall biosynthesis